MHTRTACSLLVDHALSGAVKGHCIRKFASLAIVLSGLATMLSGCHSASPHLATLNTGLNTGLPAAATQFDATVAIKGMACPFCTYNVERELLRVPGVEHIRVSLSHSIAYMVLSRTNPPTAEQLRAAVKKAGFTAGAVKLPGK